MRVTNRQALVFMGNVQRVVQPSPETDKLIDLLEFADDVHLWLACKAAEVKGVVGTEDFANKLLRLATLDIGSGIVITPDKGLCLLNVAKSPPTASDMTAEVIDLFPVPGYEEAAAHVEKIKAQRSKGNGDANAQEPVKG